MGSDGEPVVVGSGLLLEGAVEDLLHVVEAEGAHGRPRDGVGWRRECGVDDVHSLAVVPALVRPGCRFCAGWGRGQKAKCCNYQLSPFISFISWHSVFNMWRA